MKKLIYSIVIFVLCVMGVDQSLFAVQQHTQQDAISQMISQASTTHDLEKAGKAAQIYQERFDNIVYSALESGAMRYKVESDIRNLSKPEKLVPRFLNELYKRYDEQAISQWTHDQSVNRSMDYDGGISGQVTADGEAPTLMHDILVIAFDSYGYFAGLSNVSTNSSYSISNLPDGPYYVVTWSQYYIDEIYDNIDAPLSSMEAWRQATTVQVSGGTVTDINFDLKKPALVSGSVYDDNSMALINTDPPLSATFVVTTATSPLPIFTLKMDVEGGNYDDLPLPGPGEYKIFLRSNSSDYDGAWYGNQQLWQDAQTITVSNYGEQLTGMDFNLTQIINDIPTGTVKGSITLDNGLTGLFNRPLVSLVFAYDAEFETMAGFTVALLGSYTLEDLPAGDYYIFADDYLEDMQPDVLVDYKNYLGEFYNDAKSIMDATPVSVTDGGETSNINFKLEQGGSISGSITREQDSTPLDSMLVIALNAGSLFGEEPMLTSMGLALTVADQNGNYSLTGLPNGDYIVRTISSFRLDIDLLQQDFSIVAGKHKGTVVDEFYNDVQHLGQLDKLETVTIENYGAVSGINFQLTSGAHINGAITDAVSGESVEATMLVLLDAETAIPTYVIGQLGNIVNFNGFKHDGLAGLTPGKIQPDGTFSMGPVPYGDYKLLVIPGPFEGKDYLPEFYDGIRDFEDANTISVSSTEVNGINITLEKGAVIQGHVDLGGQDVYPAGADTLYKIPVLVYNTSALPVTLESIGFVQFNGGFRISNLPPGSYKVAVLPMYADYAVTYMGGGDSYFDANTETITLDYGDVHTENIKPDPATGQITGKVLAEDTGDPLYQVSVLAYDSDGFIAGFGMSDKNIISGEMPSSDGSYAISGMRDGNYHVRSFSMTTMIDMMGGLLDLAGELMFSNWNDMLMGLVAGNLDIGGIDLDLTMYMDEWYSDVPAGLDIYMDDNLLMQIMATHLENSYENNLLPIYLPLPVRLSSTGDANTVAVNAGGATTGIDFVLEETDIISLLTDVKEEETAVRPDEFLLDQNYPNPFNPVTTLSFNIAKRSHVSIKVYDTLGRQVQTLYNGESVPGMHSVRWNGLDQQGHQVAAGIYFATLRAGSYQQTIKMLYVK